ncbi:YbjN domain-containing protein [Corynebacterium sp. NML130628]|uniref:YbjN domain-containing protein n=1 Tax=Corynebacterium sp. NML130628 TaxID=1906333 RepID=UPI0008FAEA1D|nr:YbjN domain-containing protein [Corynebacterium sp. NML130628]OIR45570.1 hypothetical protein BJP07_04265 [Corynebacterium sp. NML130628]
MSTNTPSSQVTIDRIIDQMRGHGVELADDPTGRVSHANLNDFHVLFVLLDTVLIVRADAETDTPADATDPSLYLAANQTNSSLLGCRAVVANRGETIVVRTESEIHVAAGMTDEQLSSALRRATDQVMYAQNTMKVLSETIADAAAQEH